LIKKIIVLGVGARLNYCKDILKFNKNFEIKYIESEDFNKFIKYFNDFDGYFLASRNIIKITNFLKKKRINKKKFINVIHPTSYISSSAKIGINNIINAKSVINNNSLIGNFNMINTGAIIEHNAVIKNFVTMAPGSIILGHAKIENSVFLGANSTIKETLKVGSDCVISANSFLNKDLKKRSKFFGVGKILKKI
jgi:UDP-3-O-[3-hydroxymyristoyl] glucosamine N-acyltransferase